ncbi:MAG: zinc ribbon domain-containing protein [Oscillospiraceae bacterium]|jgi:hypothetical protein|nr:zinc ribbon domain-containing protein [Oscillospiraceae bacterium]
MDNFNDYAQQKPVRTFSSLRRYTVAAWLALFGALSTLGQYAQLEYQVSQLASQYANLRFSLLLIAQIQLGMAFLTFILRLALLRRQKLYYGITVVGIFALNVLLTIILYAIMGHYVAFEIADTIGMVGGFVVLSLGGVFWLIFLNPYRLMKSYPDVTASTDYVPASTLSSIQCPNCGRKLTFDSAFCDDCGSPLASNRRPEAGGD